MLIYFSVSRKTCSAFVTDVGNKTHMIIYYKCVCVGGGGYFHMYAYWVCAARVSPHFQP